MMPAPARLPRGYQADFISPSLPVPLPVIQQPHPAGISKRFDYLHFSVVASKKRQFPYFSATNINGPQFRQLDRADNWREDPNAMGWQWGTVLYVARKSDFDKGHMTKREDPQWGTTDAVAAQAADETFFFTNVAPQMASLNQRLVAWRGLEDYILHDEARLNKGRDATAEQPGLLISVFTGPVLSAADPVFVTTVLSQRVQLPELFWKVVYYTNDGLELRRVGFLMGQRDAMQQAGVVGTNLFDRFKKLLLLENFFEDYKDAEPFQVGVSYIEGLTGLTFPAALETHPDKVPNPLRYEVRPANKMLLTESIGSSIRFTNLVL